MPSNVVQLGAFFRRKKGVTDCQGESPPGDFPTQTFAQLLAHVAADDAINNIVVLNGPVDAVQWLQAKIRRIQEGLRK